MPLVDIPNVGLVEFPDTMSHDDITHAITTKILPGSKQAEKPVEQAIAKPVKTEPEQEIPDYYGGAGIPFKQDVNAYTPPPSPIQGSVMENYVPKRTEGISQAPAKEEYRNKINANWEMATPQERLEMQQEPGLPGQLARSRALEFEKSVSTPMTEELDPRVEARVNQMTQANQQYKPGEVGYINPEDMSDIARSAIARGLLPGEELGKVSVEPSKFNFGAYHAFNDGDTFLKQAARTPVKFLLGAGQSVNGLYQMLADAQGATVVSDWLKNKNRSMEQLSSSLGEPKSYVGKTIENSVISIAQQLPFMLGAVATGGESLLPYAGMYLTTLGQSYNEGSQAGLKPIDNLTRASFLAAAEVIGEIPGMAGGIKGLKQILDNEGVAAAKTFLANHLKEQGGEQITNALQFGFDKFAPKLGLKPNATAEDYIESVVDTLAQTAVQTGIMSSAGPLISKSNKLLEGAKDFATNKGYSEQLQTVDAMRKAEAAKTEAINKWQQTFAGIEKAQTPADRAMSDVNRLAEELLAPSAYKQTAPTIGTPTPTSVKPKAEEEKNVAPVSEAQDTQAMLEEVRKAQEEGGEKAPETEAAVEEEKPVEKLDAGTINLATYNATNPDPLKENDTPLSIDDAQFIIESLIEKVKRNRFKVSDLAQTEFGERLDTPTIMSINEGLRTDPMGTLQSLLDSLNKKSETKEPVQKFDITKTDASETFGEGAKRIKYTDPISGGYIDVLSKPDGTASVMNLEVPKEFQKQGIGQRLQAQVLQDYPLLQGQVSSKAAATTAYRLGRRPLDNPNATLQDVFNTIDEQSSVNLVSPEFLKQQTKPKTAVKEDKPAPSKSVAKPVITQEEVAPMVIRQENARNRFIDSAMEQFGLSKEDASDALDHLIKIKEVKLNSASGQADLKTGALWNKDSLEKAARIKRGEPEPKPALSDEDQQRLKNAKDNLQTYSANLEGLKARGETAENNAAVERYEKYVADAQKVIDELEPKEIPKSEYGTDEKETKEIAESFKDAKQSSIDDGFQIDHLFDSPKKGEVVRLQDKVKVYHAEHGWMTPEQAKEKIEQWKEHAAAQADLPGNPNQNKVVLSLFDYTGQWSQPWEDAGYNVFRFDIQNDPEVGDVNNFSTEFFNDWFSSFDGQDIYAILAACPCTDFASSGARHFAAKDEDGRTVASIQLVKQTLATIEYFKPSVWAIENPVGRIEKLGGLPPWRLSFDPNHLGDPYTKKTLLWGRFNGDLPIAPVEPTEGSKMHSKYGGKSLATKNARSVTPEGFAYGFFMANNAVDHPLMALSNKYDRLDTKVLQDALNAGIPEEEIFNAIDDHYYDLNDADAEQALRDLIDEFKPEEQEVAPQIPVGMAKMVQNRDRSTQAAINQMNDIAANLDYDTVSMSRNFQTGSPVVAGFVNLPEDQIGKEETITAGKRKFKVRYAVVEAKDIAPSNKADGTVDPRFADTSYTGLRAIAGNGRVAGVQAAYQRGNTTTYKEAMAEDSAHGIDPDVINNMAEPILVRLMPMSEVTEDIGDVTNIQPGLKMNPVEQAKNDINRVDLTDLRFDDNGRVTYDAVVKFINSMPVEERGDLLDNGTPSEAAFDRLNAAIFQQAYGNDELTRLAYQARDPEAKLIINALAGAAAPMSRLKDEGQYDIRNNVAMAAEMAINAIRRGMKVSDLKSLLNQQDLDRPVDDITRKIGIFFADNPRSAKAVSEGLSRAAAMAYHQSQAGEDVFGEPPAPIEMVLDEAFKQKPEGSISLFNVGANTLTLKSDIPNERWLKSNREDAEADGLNRFGTPKYYGKTTGKFNRTVLMPVGLLAKIRGARNEQNNVRQDDLNAIKEILKETGRLPQYKEEDYVPFITVYQDGTPYVSEGNHRIMAANELGFKYIPVEIVYFNGAEIEQGIVSPDKVEAYDRLAASEGYSIKNYNPVIGLYTVSDEEFRKSIESMDRTIDFYKEALQGKKERDALIRKYAGLKNRMGAIERRFINDRTKQGDAENYKLLAAEVADMKSAIEMTRKPRTNPEDVLARAAKELAENARDEDQGISRDVYEVIKRMYEKNPEFLAGLRLSVKTPGEYNIASGQYIDIAHIVRLFKGTDGVTDPSALRHELTHSMEEMMTIEQSLVVIDAWGKALLKASKAAKTEEEKQFFVAVGNFITNPNEQSLRRAIMAMPDNSYYQYVNPSEYWAVNAEPLMKAYLGNAWEKFKSSMKGLWEAIKDVLGFDSKRAVHRTFKQIMNGEMDRSQNKILARYIGREVSLYAPKGKIDRESLAAMRSTTGRKNYLGKPAPLAQWENTESGWKDNMQYWFQDKFVDLKRTQEAIKRDIGYLEDAFNAYDMEQTYHGRVARRMKNFMNDEILPIVKKMKDLDVGIEQVNEYMHMRHATERNNHINEINKNPNVKDQGSGVSTQQAKDYFANLSKEDKDKLDEVAHMWDEVIHGTQELLVASGLETQDTIDSWRELYDHYVPLHREDLDYKDGKSGGGFGMGFGVKGSSTKRAMGSTKKVVDIMEEIAVQRQVAIVRAEKVRVARALYGLTIAAPNPDFWLAVNPDALKNKKKLLGELASIGFTEEDAKNYAPNIMQEPKTGRFEKNDPRTKERYLDELTGEPTERVNYVANSKLRNANNVLPVRINGKDRYIFFNANDPRAKRMVESIKNLDVEKLNWVMQKIGGVTRWIAAVNTQYNPVFAVWNFSRDLQGSLLNLSTTPLAGKQAEVFANVWGALPAIYKGMRRDRRGEELSPEASESQKDWDDLLQDFLLHGGQTGYRDQFTKSGEKKDQIARELKKLDTGWAKRQTKNFFDQLSDVNEAMENAVRLSVYKVALDNGLSPQKAAVLAKNITVNFNRKGKYGPQLGAAFAFFNASIQGTARLYETLKGPAGKKIIWGGIMVGIVQSLALAIAGYDDDDVPEYIKERNLIIPLGGGKYFMWPMPLGFNIIPNIGRTISDMVIDALLHGGKNVPKKLVGLVGSTLNSFNPLGSTGFSLQTISPTILDPFVALINNRDAFGRPIAKEDRATNPIPGYKRSRENATEISKVIAESLNWISSGGKSHTKGFISPTADQLDYLVGQFAGGVGREAMGAARYVKSFITGEDVQPHQVPVVGKIIGSTESPAAVSAKFYENITRMAEHEQEIKNTKNINEVRAYRRDNPESRLWHQANSVENTINQRKSEIKKLMEKNPNNPAIKRLKDRNLKDMESFNKRVKAAEQ